MTHWFPGGGQDTHDEAFLARLRERAAEGGLVDVAPDDTHCHVRTSGALVVCAIVPGMADDEGDVALQVGWAYAPTGRPFFVGEWNGEHDFLIDGWDQVDIPHPEGSATPEAFADRALEWMTEQLRHPVARLDWTSGRGSPRSEWYFTDTGRRLWEDGFRRWWFERRAAPDRVVHLR